MLITLNADWKTFEDYKAALKSKYRVKVNKADSKSNALKRRIFSKKDIEHYKDELQNLYQNTIDNANFNAQVLDLNTYVKLKDSIRHDVYCSFSIFTYIPPSWVAPNYNC